MDSGKTGFKGEERRRHGRLEVSLPVTMRYQGRLVPATAMNLSCGGALLDAASAVVCGDRPVELIFDLSAVERDVAIRGQVVRSESVTSKSRVGVRFINLFTSGHETIGRYIARQMRNK